VAAAEVIAAGDTEEALKILELFPAYCFERG
jgi:hypothetical protein